MERSLSSVGFFSTLTSVITTHADRCLRQGFWRGLIVLCAAKGPRTLGERVLFPISMEGDAQSPSSNWSSDLPPRSVSSSPPKPPKPPDSSGIGQRRHVVRCRHGVGVEATHLASSWTRRDPAP